MNDDPPEPPDDGDKDGVQNLILYAMAFLFGAAAYTLYLYLKLKLKP